jgi:hypothetical protein
MSYDAEDIGGYAHDHATCSSCGRRRDAIARCTCEHHHTQEPARVGPVWLVWSLASAPAWRDRPIPYHTAQSALAAARGFGGKMLSPDGQEQEFPAPAWVRALDERRAPAVPLRRGWLKDAGGVE